jgi:hypothetical protein
MNTGAKVKLALGILSLLPTSILLENSDGAEIVDSVGAAFNEWFASILLSAVISIIPWIILNFAGKKSYILSVFTYTCFSVSAFLLFILYILPIIK